MELSVKARRAESSMEPAWVNRTRPRTAESVRSRGLWAGVVPGLAPVPASVPAVEGKSVVEDRSPELLPVEPVGLL